MAPTFKNTVLDQNPENNNFLSPLNFKFILKRAPHLNFFLQKIIFPSINVPPVKQPTPFVDIWRPGVDTEFGPLTVTYRVDEDLQNWQGIFNWLLALGEEESLAEYGQLAVKPEWLGEGVVSDITVTILDSARNPNYTFYFHDCFPITLSNMTFENTPQSIPYQQVSTTFRYTNFDFEKVI